MSSGYESLDHTADLALRLWSDSLPGLLQQGALALTELLMDGQAVAATEERSIAVEGLDQPDVLVRWLAELLYLATVDGFVTAHAEPTVQGLRVAATLRGACVGVRQEIKAVTYHDLSVVQSDGQWTARVVLDV